MMALSLLVLLTAGCGSDTANEGEGQAQQELISTLNDNSAQPAGQGGGVEQNLLGNNSPDTVQGTVRQVGSAPLVRTVLQRGSQQEAFQISGPQQEQLGRLVGARVQIMGTLKPGGTGTQIQAQDFDILSVGGQKPVVGRLVRQENGRYVLTRNNQENLPLPNISEGLTNATGGKVWVVLGDDGGVQRFGVLVPPTTSQGQ